MLTLLASGPSEVIVTSSETTTVPLEVLSLEVSSLLEVASASSVSEFFWYAKRRSSYGDPLKFFKSRYFSTGLYAFTASDDSPYVALVSTQNASNNIPWKI